ncbi:ATP-binding protein [Calothrix sp. NIES-3974]|uniref:ATP-binding protein n=1 Tax=Calothrix sp. NIES-3974 TaxID=2005462 RepID=UPI000B61D042|nr:ATP-binding protein [Calothrix sp. NIES-3974]BAZ04987.1 two-component sensor histidine kinase [Calothrix sp. NIES-3974]
MNPSLMQDLSIFQTVRSGDFGLEPLVVSPSVLLSMIRAHMDVLIDEKIPATIFAKLPDGKLWRGEIQRYLIAVKDNSKIYTLSQKTEVINPIASNHYPVAIPKNGKLRREYFFLVLSPRFSSLVAIIRPGRGKKRYKNLQTPIPWLATINTFNGQAIATVVTALQAEGVIGEQDISISQTPDGRIMGELAIKQMLRHNEIAQHKNSLRLHRCHEYSKRLSNLAQVKDNYLSSVCQELRAPLTHMKTALSLLNSPTLKPLQRQRYLQMLSTQCDRQNSLINGVVELLEIEKSFKSPHFEAVNLSEVVPGVVSTYQPLAHEKGIMLAYTVPSDLPEVWFISGGLKQIIINLLANSIKFTPKGGQVWVKVREQGEAIHIEVRDTGIGIPEGELSKIFDRFYRIRTTSLDENTGAGLGLSVVQELLQRCGGSISVKSKPGEGSIFTVHLPIRSLMN